jgi:hypothetical protein
MTMAVATTTRIQLRPAPISDPPYDDEVEQEPQRLTSSHVQGALALAFTLPSGLPAVPAYPPPLRVVPPADGHDDDDEVPRRITARSELPDPRRFAARLAQAIIEVVSGARPATQLVRWTSAAVYDDICGRLTRLARAGAPGTRGVVAGSVRSVRVSEPLDGVAEVCAVVQRRGRATAVALRLEGLDGRWMCTELTFV